MSTYSDWIFSSVSNVHVAKDRTWFTEYTPITSVIYSTLGDSVGSPVIGIGTVELPTKRAPHLTGEESHGVLVLHNVLHAPSVFCNILGMPIYHDYKVAIEAGRGIGSIKDHNGKWAAYLSLRRLLCLEVLDQPVGQTLEENKLYSLGVTWPLEEMDMCMARNPQPAPVEAGASPGYNAEEKAYLKKHFKSEYYFLRYYGLSIYKEEHREEGRAILRAFMSEDARLDDDEVCEDH